MRDRQGADASFQIYRKQRMPDFILDTITLTVFFPSHPDLALAVKATNAVLLPRSIASRHCHPRRAFPGLARQVHRLRCQSPIPRSTLIHLPVVIRP